MRTYIFIFFVLLSAVSCNKDKYNAEPPGFGNMAIAINYDVDGSPLSFDSVYYTNQAGNVYTVSRLQYYVSGIKLYKNGELAYTLDSIFYVDARKASTNNIILRNIPSFNYDQIVFTIGVEDKFNIHGQIASTLENVAMEWPDMMGGGYHFLKLEGHFKDSTTTPGFAMHLGKTGMQPLCTVNKKFYVPINTTTNYDLTMNVNEWFKNPKTYNFLTDGVYTMGDMILMEKLRMNGCDVFYAK